MLLHVAPALEEGLHFVVGVRLLDSQLHEPLEDEGVEVWRQDEELLAVLNEDCVLVCAARNKFV